MNYFLSLTASVVLFIGCKGQTEQKKLRCYNEQLKHLQQQQVYHEVLHLFNDTLNAWINREITKVQVYKEIIWQIDSAVFFNPTQDKAILLILKQDTAIYQEKRSPEDTLAFTFLDYIKMIYANKEADGWHFYYQSMPSIVIARGDLDKPGQYNSPTSFARLSEMGRTEVLKGYYRAFCKYNDEFFDRWDITNLKKKHQRFITNDYDKPFVPYRPKE